MFLTFPILKQGEVSVQDGAAQLATILLDCQDGMSVLDACAAPWWKNRAYIRERQKSNGDCG